MYRPKSVWIGQIWSDLDLKSAYDRQKNHDFKLWNRQQLRYQILGASQVQHEQSARYMRKKVTFFKEWKEKQSLHILCQAKYNEVIRIASRCHQVNSVIAIV